MDAIKYRRKSTYAVDRISSLPPNITEHILQCLPLKDAVRTSILSTYWRYKWSLLPQLVLDKPFFFSIQKLNEYDDPYFGIKFSSETLDVRMLELANIVNNILLRHHGPIHKFVLHIPRWFLKDADISHWIDFVSRKLVKEFTLSESRSRTRKLPSRMFSCVELNHLTHLTLINWSLPSVSTTFRGFPCLISLKLHLSGRSDGDAHKLGILVSKCPLLEILDLKIYEKRSCLSINAPNLQNFVVDGQLSGIFLEETERIRTLSLQCQLDHKRDLMTELFSCLPLIEKLVLGYRFWLRCHGKVGQRLEKLKNSLHGKFRELKNLVLDEVQLDSQLAVSYMLCLLQMAPMLQTLEINVADECEPDPNDVTIVGDCCLDHLKSAKFICASCTSSSSYRISLQLIKMILSSSPVLKVMTIEATREADEKFNIAKELLRYRRASTAEIIFKT